MNGSTDDQGGGRAAAGAGGRFRDVALPAGLPGALFLHSMPGKHEPFAEALGEIRSSRISCIVCLAEPVEIAGKSPAYARAIAEGTLPCRRVLHPIPDWSIPADEESTRMLATDIAAGLRAGERFLLHCSAGVGRTGTIATCILLALGLPLEEAGAAVRAAAAGPENEAQRRFVQRIARNSRRE